MLLDITPEIAIALKITAVFKTKPLLMLQHNNNDYPNESKRKNNAQKLKFRHKNDRSQLNVDCKM